MLLYQFAILERNIFIPVILNVIGGNIKVFKKQTPQTEVLYGDYYKRISINDVILHGEKIHVSYQLLTK